MKTVKIRLDGLGGMPMDEKTLKSTYATGMDFEPDERRMTIDSEGIVSLQVTKEPYMIHVKMAVPLYGHLWVMADNQGEPKWLFGLPYPELRREAANIARHHVSTYRDTIQYWDAMNEAHDWANCFELTQEQLIDLTRATTDALREGNDKAVSIVNVCLPFAEYVAGRYNCYGALPEHLRSPLSYFKAIIEAGIDFDVVGIQLYFPGRDLVAVDLLLNTFAALGKPIHITEMGVNGGFRQKGNAGSSWSQMAMSEGTWHGGWNEHTQADWLEQFYTIAASRREIQALTWWDFIEPSFSGNGAMLYENENPRELYFRLLALKNRIIRKA